MSFASKNYHHNLYHKVQIQDFNSESLIYIIFYWHVHTRRGKRVRGIWYSESVTYIHFIKSGLKLIEIPIGDWYLWYQITTWRLEVKKLKKKKITTYSKNLK